jgi:tetratricopeptide (TPR) repeat protein
MPLFRDTLLGPICSAALLAAMVAGGCTGKKSSKFEMPPDRTPEARSAQVTKAESLARDAQRMELSGHPDEAIAKYSAAIEAYPELPVAWNNLGVLLAKRGKNLEAAEAYKTASELSPTDPTSLYNLGALWEQLGYLDDAARWYDESLQRDPNYLPALERSILVDDLRAKLSQTTADRLKAAILMERQPWWINRFKRIQQRMNERPLERTLDDHAGASHSMGSPAAVPPAVNPPVAPPATTPPATPPASAPTPPAPAPGTDPAMPPPTPAPLPNP